MCSIKGKKPGELDEIQKEAGEKLYLVIATCQICKDLKEFFSDLFCRVTPLVIFDLAVPVGGKYIFLCSPFQLLFHNSMAL